MTNRISTGTKFLMSKAAPAPLLAVLFCLYLAVAAGAQTPEQVTEVTKSLSPEAQTVITRLTDLGTLPPEGWKFHLGDIPHGEALDLEDKNWSRADRSFQIPADKTAWFRGRVEVPRFLRGYDLTGCRVWFQFRFSGASIFNSIVYFNGRRVAMGEGLEPIVLFENAKPGENILVAVKLPLVGDSRSFRGVTLAIEASPSRPGPEDLRQEFLTAAALLTDQAAAAAGGSTAEKTQLERAIMNVDTKALDRGDQSAFDASLKRARAELERLKPSIAKFTFYMAGNSHIDSAWLWPWTESVETVRRTFGTAAQLMLEYPDYTFSQSSAQHSEWLAEKYPYINDEIRRRVKEGRWEIVGGMWVEPDLNMPDGESLVRQLLVGTRYFKSQYGVDVRVGWNPDSFGYSWQLPQIYKKSGIDYFVMSKLMSNETHKLPFSLFWWESPDGSRVLTYLARRYDSKSLAPGRLAADLAPTLRFAPGSSEMMDLYGVGDHGGGPTRLMLDEGVRWREGDRVAPKMRFGTAQSFFTSVERKLYGESPLWNYRSIAGGYTPPPAPPEGKIAVPTWKDELYYEFHRGVMTTEANHKRNMRESEQWLLNSEKYASLASLVGDPYPSDKLTEAWKKVLFNQFHDLAAGTGFGVIFKEAEKDYEQVRLQTDKISQQALTTIASEINTRAAVGAGGGGGGGGVPVLVFNPLAWNRSGTVTVEVQMPAAASTATAGVSVIDPAGKTVPSKILSADRKRNIYRLLLFVSGVPSMGYKVLNVVPGSRRFISDLKAEGLTLENDALRVTVDPKTGNISSLFNKRGNFETLAPGAQGNQLQTFADNPKCCDAWNIDPGTLDRPVNLTKADSVKLVESGPLRSTIRVSRTWQKSRFTQDITLYAGADQVEVANDIDWRERHQLLKVAFPLGASSDSATYEIPYGTIERPTTRNNSWEETMFEVAALRWADLGDGQKGFSLINDSKYGYDARGNVLRLSLLRSPTEPNPEADQGHHEFSYSLYPHAGDWKRALTMRKGYEYNYKLTAMQVQPHAGRLPLEYSYLTVEPETVVLTAMKKAEDADGLMLRLVEWAGRSGEVKIKVPDGAVSATVTNLMEKAEGSKINATGGMIRLPIRPYEILSVRVDYARPPQAAER